MGKQGAKTGATGLRPIDKGADGIALAWEGQPFEFNFVDEEADGITGFPDRGNR